MTQNNNLKCIVALSMMTLLAAGCAVFSGKESGGQYLDDATITSKVKAQLVNDTTTRRDSPQIHVETMRGTVQLSGFVDSLAIRDRAEVLTYHVDGVKSVQDNLIVHSD
ncbi:MAG TPA: BON domain-containing protein [Rickettsiales bacterium]|nr:BON domain-containing protein [Rickettsiales bacterium]